MKYYVPLALLLIVLAFKFCSTNFPVDHYLNETNRVLRGGFPIGAGWWLNFSTRKSFQSIESAS